LALQTAISNRSDNRNALPQLRSLERGCPSELLVASHTTVFTNSDVTYREVDRRSAAAVDHGKGYAVTRQLSDSQMVGDLICEKAELLESAVTQSVGYTRTIEKS
jgi:hypothetical protein